MQIVRSVVETSVGESTVALIDLEGLDIGVDNLIPEHLQFSVKTYAKLDINASPSNWTLILKPINKFLRTLPDKDLVVIGKMFYDIKYVLTHEFQDINQIIPITTKLSNIIGDADQQIKLAVKIHEFVKNSDIPIPDLRGIGKRPQDRKSMTFYAEDYIGLNAIVLICKLFCPVFGHIIFLTKKVVDNSLKESHCIAILRNILYNTFDQLTDKLHEYIHNIVLGHHRSNTLTSTYNGYTHDRFSLFIYSAMLVKKFVNVDLYNDSGNIMVYVLSCSRSTLNSLNVNMCTKNTMMERRPPELINDAEGNTSNLEVESFASRSTADVPIILEVGTNQLITRMLDEFDLDANEFEKAYAFYKSSPIPMTDINKYVACTFIGNRMGGAIGIDFLRANTYMKLITLIQMYMISIGYDQLVHLMSVIPTDAIKTTRSHADMQIALSRGASFAYRNCKAMFPNPIGGISWDSKAKVIIDEIVTRIHRFNTAPNLWAMMGEKPINESKYVYDERVVRSIFEFIHHLLKVFGQSLKEEVC